jgi:hypothetical protein
MIRMPAMFIALVLGMAMAIGCAGEKADPAGPAARTEIEITTPDTSPAATTVLVAPPAEPLRVVAGDRQRAATRLKASAECSAIEPGLALASLAWRPARELGTEQRIAITILPAGFETDDFRLSDPIAREVSSLEWRAIEGQAVHYWRVLTHQPEGWIASTTGSFTGPICVADEGSP